MWQTVIEVLMWQTVIEVLMWQTVIEVLVWHFSFFDHMTVMCPHECMMSYRQSIVPFGV